MLYAFALFLLPFVMRMKKYSSPITGHLDIIVAEYETEYAADETTVLSEA